MSTAVPGHLRPLSAQSAALEADRALLGRTTAERVADVLRTRISEGFFAPGTRLAEDVIGGDLGVSRNTLREAFQREILGRVETGDGPGGERLLADYLDRAREQLVGAHAQQTATGK